MRKLIALFVLSFAVVFCAGPASAYWFGGYDWMYGEQLDLYTWVGPGQTFAWNHDVPDDVFQVTQAKLWIDLAYLDQYGAEVIISGEWNFDLNNDPAWMSIFEEWFDIVDNTCISLPNGYIGDGFWYDPLNVSFTAGQCDRVRVDRSVLAMDYTPGSNIPEPASMILLGLGLVGTAAVRRFRK